MQQVHKVLLFFMSGKIDARRRRRSAAIPRMKKSYFMHELHTVLFLSLSKNNLKKR